MSENNVNQRFETKRQMLGYFMKGSVKWFALSILFTLVVTLMDMINPKIISFTVDSVIGDKPAALPSAVLSLVDRIGGTGYLRNHLGILAGIVVLLALIRALFRYLWRVFNAKGAETFVETTRNSVFSHLLALPVSWYSSHHTGDIIQRCTSDIETIKVFLSEQLASLFRIIPTLCLAFVFMYRIHPKLMGYALLFVPLIIGYSLFFHSRIGTAFRKADEEEGKLSAIAQENLTGVRVVRAFGKEQYERTRFEEKNRTYTALWIRLMRLLAAFWCSMDLLSGAQILTVTSLGAVYAVHGELTAGNYIAFLTYNTMMIWPVRMLGRIIANLSKSGVAIDRLREIMNAEPEKDAENAQKPDMTGDISFEHVSFSFTEESRNVLNDVSFEVKAGSTVGILGATGSGKSTLMYLLDRIYPLPAENGRITIGGTDIQQIDSYWLRSHIGIVLQEPYLFSRTLEENIRIASPHAGRKEVRDAAGIAVLDESIERFEDGYDTFVGERGVTLSGGQKQRTAIAQMLIRKPPIMVFDDSLSAVDAETDTKIRAALAEKTGDSTVFLIAHRITTLMNADEIIILDRGRLAERGTHEELLAQNGIYRRIFDLQMAGREVEE